METTTIYPYYNTPAIGKRITLNNEPVIVTAHGDACRITDDDPSAYGSHLLGFEGSKGRQVTVRSATTEELADLNAARALKSRRDRRAERPADHRIPRARRAKRQRTCSATAVSLAAPPTTLTTT